MNTTRPRLTLPGRLLLMILGLFSGLFLSLVIVLATAHHVKVPIVKAGSQSTVSRDDVVLTDADEEPAAWGAGGRTRVFVDPDFPIERVRQKSSNVENVLVFGVDSRSASEVVCRADTLIIMSIDRKNQAIKLTSVMRDTQVKIAGRHQPDKINAAYAYGGVGLLINTINRNFDLDIQRFVMFDFWSAASLIDAAGGVRIDVSKAELPYLNHNLNEQNKLVPEASRSPKVSKAGKQLLDGRQAIAWARIRKLDSDYQRASRQRTVMLAMLAKLKSGNPLALMRMTGQGLRHLETNLNGLDLVRLGSAAMPLVSRRMLQYRLPEEGLYTVIENPWSMQVDMTKQIPALHRFIWEDSASD